MAFTHNGAFGAITTSTLPGAGAAAPVPGVARAQSEAELDRIGREFGMNLAINANPPQGFSLRMADGAGAVNELTTYQIMKGGYDGRTRLLAEFHRPHVKGLDDPFITLDFLGQDRVIERLLGPLPSTALPGSLEEWREKAAREQAYKIIRGIQAYNPVQHQVCSLKRQLETREISQDEAQFHPRADGAHLFREDEMMEIALTPVDHLPRLMYLEGLRHLLGDVRHALGHGG